MSRQPLSSLARLLLALLSAFTLTLGACSDDPASTTDVGEDQDAGEDPTEDPTADPIADPTPDTPDQPNDTPDGQVDANTDIPVSDGAGDPDAVDPGNGLRVIAVSPQRGPETGGTEILIIGLNFTFDTDIYLGSSLCDNIDVIDETKITCETPPNLPGAYAVKAINDLGLNSLANAFTYFAPITLDEVEPNRGPTSGGMPMTVFGEGFGPGTQVSVGGRVGIGIEVVDGQTLRFILPAGVAGPATVRVSGVNGLAALDGAFEYFEPVRIDRILPGSGPASGGAESVVEGAGFTDEDDLSVTFGLLEANLEVVDDATLIVTPPAGPADAAVDVTISSELNGAFTVREGYYYYTSTAGLALHHAMPRRGSADGGTGVVLSGSGLDAVTSVRFGGIGATIVEAAETYLIVETPAHAVGVVTIEVGDGATTASLVNAFTYVQPVRIDSIAPATGDAAGGDAVTLTGVGFVAGTTVRIGPLPASSVSITNSTTLTAVTPPGAVGPSDVRIQTPEGASAVLVGGFTYTSEVFLLGFSPTKGAVAGGTHVVLRGAGFVAPVVVTFGTVEAPEITILDSATLSVRTPPAPSGFVQVGVRVGEGEVVNGPERFLYFDPTLSSGGHFGDHIDGAVNVTVISQNGAPLPNAFVMLSVRADAAFFGYTDANGQVTLSGPGISGAQTVTATRVGFSSATVEAVNAENVTVTLSCVPENQCGGTGDCREGFVCTCGPPFAPVGICLVDPYCGFEAETQEQFDAACVPQFPPVPFGLVTGNLTGVEKVDDPGPGERVMGVVFTTQPHPFQASNVNPGTGNVRSDNGPYTLRSRIGEVAIIGVCGIFNDVTNTFTPKYMGVRRGLFVVDAETYTVDIDCDIRMNQTITLKVPTSPFAPNGPNTYLHVPYLHFGSEGYFGGIVELAGTSDILSSTGFAPLTGQLAGLDYYIVAGAFTGDTFPETQAVLDNLTNVNGIITLPPFVPAAELTQPVFGGLLVDRYIEWDMVTDVEPDFYSILIYDFNFTIFWDVLVPGTQTNVNLPHYPPDADVGAFPPGTLILQILAVDAILFDYDNFDNFNNFVLDNWRSWSTNVFLINNPG